MVLLQRRPVFRTRFWETEKIRRGCYLNAARRKARNRKTSEAATDGILESARSFQTSRKRLGSNERLLRPFRDPKRVERVPFRSGLWRRFFI
jgi:hypothetical protein